MNKCKENSTDTAFKKFGALERTIALLTQTDYGNPECFVEASVIFEIYNSCLTNANLPQDLFNNAGKVVTPIKKTINLDLSRDKYFDQIDSIPSELISLIGLTTENFSSSRNAS